MEDLVDFGILALALEGAAMNPNNVPDPDFVFALLERLESGEPILVSVPKSAVSGPVPEAA
jgi:hypothetical protein